MEDHDIAYDDLSEHSYLNHNRRQIKKSVYLRNRLKTKAWWDFLICLIFVLPCYSVLKFIFFDKRYELVRLYKANKY